MSEENNPPITPESQEQAEDRPGPDDSPMAKGDIALPTGQTEILNQQPETTTDMEVHHHTHPGHHKKRWTDYFWEFLMLFLAVFCGFLAEYQLEHVIENQREKVFIKSMVEDLQNDHDQLNIYISGLKLGLNQMDSMVTMLDDTKTIKENGSLIYFFGRLSPRLLILTNNNRTFDQLKNSGGFRLIRNANASNKIMEYYGSLQFIRHLEGLYFQEFDEYKKIASKIFEPAVLRSMEEPDGNISRQTNNPTLITSNPELLKELGVFAVYMNGSRRSIIPTAEALQQKGDALMAELKKEYYLD